MYNQVQTSVIILEVDYMEMDYIQVFPFVNLDHSNENQ